MKLFTLSQDIEDKHLVEKMFIDEVRYTSRHLIDIV